MPVNLLVIKALFFTLISNKPSILSSRQLMKIPGVFNLIVGPKVTMITVLFLKTL